MELLMKKRMFELLLFMVFMLSSVLLSAGDFDTSVLPKMLGSTNYGTDFWLTFHPNYQSAISSNSIRIYVASTVETSVTVEVPGKGYMAQNNTTPNSVIQFDIPIAIAQPFTGGISTPPPPEQVYSGAGIHVTSKDPVIVYGLARGSGSSDGYMALPVSVLGTNYIVASWADAFNNTNQFLPSYTSIIAPYDNTKVTFILGGTMVTETKGGLKPGESEQFTLYQGDVLVIPSSGNMADLSGSKIISTKPVAVVSGNRCALIPEAESNCDYLVQMELPTQVWGTEYHVAPIQKRKKNPIIKIFPKEENTEIYKNGLDFANIKYPGGIEGDGWLRIRSDAGNPVPVTYRGNKPISITLYNTSRSEDSVDIDPFEMALIPVEQYQNEAYFTTPSAKNYIEFPTNIINIIYESTPDGTVPNDLEIAREDNGKFTWSKVATSSPNPGLPFGVASNGRRYYLKYFNLPSYGSYKLRANNPFMVYAYGYSANSSYGYPASAALRNLEKLSDTLAPVPTWTMDCYGSVSNGLVEDYPRNNDRSYLSIVCFYNSYSYNYDFNYTSFIPGAKEKTNWTLNVKDKSKDARAVITFGDRTGNDTTIVLNYYVRKTDASPTTLNMGLLKIADTALTSTWIFNGSSSSPLILNKVFLKYDDRGFELLDSNMSAFNYPLIIPPLDSMEVNIRFVGKIDGVYSDSVGFSDDCFTWIMTKVSVQVGSPQIKVSDFSFPDTYIGYKSSGQVSIKNEGTNSLHITGFEGPYDSVFTLDIQPITQSNPLVLLPNQSYTFEVMFEPKDEKQYNDSIGFISDASQTDPICYLSGKGILKTGVNEIEDNTFGFKIYPNPADDIIDLSFNNPSDENLIIRIFDTFGNRIIEEVIKPFDSGLKRTFKTSELTSGVYYMQIITSHGIKSGSFSVVH